MRSQLTFLSLWAGPSLAATLGRAATGLDVGTQLAYNNNIVKIVWKGFEGVDPGKEFTGSFEEVKLQLMGIMGDSFTLTPTTEEDRLTKYDGSPPSNNVERDCDVGGYDRVGQNYIKNGIEYLSSLPDSVLCSNQPAPSPGQGSCGRISCSYNSAIWWCNDSPQTVEFACNLFAKYAQDIVDNCAYLPNNLNSPPEVRGTEIDAPFNISTVVGGDNC
ncbi:hypothetical protein F5B20DRAFT_47770 [Whalleya microplaca]|nr:hypothetical protein F5B20DRAFT_47770 [Whalleya microplaca]